MLSLGSVSGGKVHNNDASDVNVQYSDVSDRSVQHNDTSDGNVQLNEASGGNVQSNSTGRVLLCCILFKDSDSVEDGVSEVANEVVAYDAISRIFCIMGTPPPTISCRLCTYERTILRGTDENITM